MRLRQVDKPRRRVARLLVMLVFTCAATPAWAQTPATPPASEIATLRQSYSLPVAQWPAARTDAGVAFIELAPLPALPVPDREKADLGRQLFHDPRLSRNADVSCATCHDPQHGWSSGTARARGHGGMEGRRNPQGLRSIAARALLAPDALWGWDGRGGSLAAQLLFPLTAPDEMAHASLDQALVRMMPLYGPRFTALYGGLSAPALADALTTFLATLEQPTQFDRFLAGDTTALNDEAIHGLHLFRTKAGCANCHHGPLLTDNLFHNLRISAFGEPAQDLGRAGVTGRAEDAGRFRTPSLRHVRETAPYMHSGLFRSLKGVVHLYDRGGGEVWARNEQEAAHPLYPFAAQLSPHIRPLGLSQEEQAALVAFLEAL